MTIEWRKQWFEFVRKIKKKKKISHKEAMAQSSILWPKEKEKIKKRIAREEKRAAKAIAGNEKA